MFKYVLIQELSAIPPAVNNIIGKLCAFQLKITPYNIIQGCEEYTVTRVSEVIGSVGTSSNKKQKVT